MSEPRTPACPLCARANVTLERTLHRATLEEEWSHWAGIDISGEMAGLAEIPQWRCATCGLVFFPASAAGSGRLYEALQRLDWYYLAEKWEHDEALRDIPEAASLCECGCGRGDFLARVTAERRAAVLGLELNESAVREARDRSLNVRAQSLESLAAERPGVFDVVCSFQVLEHVANPREHLQAAHQLLRHGGRLLVGLPNNESFLGKEDNLLDRPPHHISRWSPAVLHAALPGLGFRVLRIATEPLLAFHTRSFVAAELRDRVARHLPRALARLVMNWRVLDSLTWLLLRTGAHQLFRGQTMYLLAERT